MVIRQTDTNCNVETQPQPPSQLLAIDVTTGETAEEEPEEGKRH
ncbi:MAG TPA: hypothetical protein VE544_07760 [Nitrososphaeraceae archaeon]|jgi:hypothetical protein|nr:hypothetical protein [Nitrososphaeraceae archaeon]